MCCPRRYKTDKRFRSPLSTDAQGHPKTSPTTLAPTNGSTTGGETMSQQRNNETRTIFAGTAAYTRYGVEETFDPKPYRSSPYKHSTYPRAIEIHDLQNEGANTVGKSMQHQPLTARIDEALHCPYHGPILQGRPTNARPTYGLAPMDRYVAEGPSERYAILHQPDTSRGATHNGCRCLELTHSSADARGQARK